MDGGAWPFLVGGVICLVNSDNERDSPLLTSRLDLDQRVACRVTLAVRGASRASRFVACSCGVGCLGSHCTPSPPLML